jgi:hypothetical protein
MNGRGHALPQAKAIFGAANQNVTSQANARYAPGTFASVRKEESAVRSAQVFKAADAPCSYPSIHLSIVV